MKKTSVGVLLVTHNAHERLRVILDSLREARVNEVVVADSSGNPLINDFDNSVSYYHCPGLSLVEKIHIYAAKINSEFILLHPDGELINTYALDYLEKQIDIAAVDFSSTLSQNLTFEKVGETVAVTSRNYRFFSGNSRYSLGTKVNLSDCLAPYHQMIWGLHKTIAFKSFFSAASRIAWDSELYLHATLFERIFNIFMHSRGRVAVSTLPLLLRYKKHSIDRSNLKIQSAAYWLDCYENGSDSHRTFFNLIVEEFKSEFGMHSEELKDLILSALRREMQWKNLNQRTSSLGLRLYRKLIKYLQSPVYAKHTYQYTKNIEISVEKNLMTDSEFEVFLSVVCPFISSRSEAIDAFN